MGSIKTHLSVEKKTLGTYRPRFFLGGGPGGEGWRLRGTHRDRGCSTTQSPLSLQSVPTPFSETAKRSSDQSQMLMVFLAFDPTLEPWEAQILQLAPVSLPSRAEHECWHR